MQIESTNKTNKNFEDSIKELELIVNEIENDEISLEDALNKYQKGLELVKICQDHLSIVAQKVKVLDNEADLLKDLGVE